MTDEIKLKSKYKSEFHKVKKFARDKKKIIAEKNNISYIKRKFPRQFWYNISSKNTNVKIWFQIEMWKEMEAKKRIMSDRSKYYSLKMTLPHPILL